MIQVYGTRQHHWEAQSLVRQMKNLGKVRPTIRWCDEDKNYVIEHEVEDRPSISATFEYSSPNPPEDRPVRWNPITCEWDPVEEEEFCYG
jgi:hypothetical protein